MTTLARATLHAIIAAASPAQFEATRAYRIWGTR